MLLCRGCSTRFENGREACPSCGRRAKTHAVDASSDSGSGLPPAPPAPRDVDDEGMELEVDESVLDEPEGQSADEDLDDDLEDDEPDEPVKKEVAPVRMRASSTPKPAPARVAPPPSRLPKPRAEAPRLSLDPAQVLALLAEQPGLIEKGLKPHAEDGKTLGIDFETPVGDIDLLLRDLRGGYVIVLVPDAAEDNDLVPGLLRRMGWVRKHLCSGGETVRAIAVMNEVPESAVYAAAGLAEGVIRFVGYRVTLEFSDHTTNS